jgi:Tol biopolymer transport system component
MNLLNMNNGQVILTVPTFVYATDYSITHFDTFSPDSRYLAFLTHGLDSPSSPTNEAPLYLNIFDIKNEELVLSLPSTQPNIYQEDASAAWWSPTSEEFVYRDEKNNFAVVDVSDGKITRLTNSGGVRLSQPQWSYDGRYLSVTIYVDDNNWWSTKTAVILAPNR